MTRIGLYATVPVTKCRLVFLKWVLLSSPESSQFQEPFQESREIKVSESYGNGTVITQGPRMGKTMAVAS